MRCFVLFVACAFPVVAQTFEAASVKKTDPGNNGFGIVFTDGGGMRANGVTLRDLVELGWDVRSFQVTNGPGWSTSDRFDILGTPPPGSPARNTSAEHQLVRQRVRALLQERFHLKVREDITETSGYALVAAKGGSKLKETALPESGGIRYDGKALAGSGVGIDIFCAILSRQVGRTVENQTGLTGRYDFELRFTPDSPVGKPGSEIVPDPDSPTLFTALQEQLGLKLEPRKISLLSIAILAAERPDAN